MSPLCLKYTKKGAFLLLINAIVEVGGRSNTISLKRRSNLEASLERALSSSQFACEDEATELGLNDDPQVAAVLAAVKQKMKGPSLDFEDEQDWWKEKDDWWKDPLELFDGNSDESTSPQDSVIENDEQTETTPNEGGSKDDSKLIASLKKKAKLFPMLWVASKSKQEISNKNEIESYSGLSKKATELAALKTSITNQGIAILDWGSNALPKAVFPLVVVLSFAALIKTFSQAAYDQLQDDQENEFFSRLTRKILQKLPWIRKKETELTITESISQQLKAWKNRCLQAERDKFALDQELVAAKLEVSELTTLVADLKISNRYLESVQRDHDELLERAVATVQREAYKEKERLKSALLHITEKELELMREEVEIQAQRLKKRVLA